jgi:pyrroloquinoline-quinone synthase
MNWQDVDQCITNHSLLNSNFYQAWSAGQLTLDDLRYYAKQYYHLEATFPRLLSRVHSNCENPQIRQMILENLNDEEQGDKNHRELWLQFAEGLGLSREEVIQATPDANTQSCINTLVSLAADADPSVGLSALYAYESQLPKVSQSKIDGLRQFYGIDTPEAIQFFEVHKGVDVWHSEQEKSAIEQLGAPLSQVKETAEKSCRALLTFLDGVHKATFVKRTGKETVCH